MSNYLDTEDNIVALATSGGPGALDVIRISGENLRAIYRKITKKKSLPSPNTIKKHNIYSPLNGELLDSSMVSFFASPKSFTGQDVLEINCHGGGYISNKIIQLLSLEKNTRIALPGEFLFRAYINNKVDLIQAESINEMISSESSKHNNKSLENLAGKLSEKVLLIKKLILNLLLTIEHELDFDESEISHISDAEIIKKTKEIIKSMESVTECYFFSKTVRFGLRLLLLGKPNVGKSSIYNQLLGINRSIVSDVPGTTRDTIESSLEINGYKVLLVDSAGFWESADAVEKMGIEKTSNEIALADIIILVGETNKDISAFKGLLKDKNVIVVRSKSDIHKYNKKQLSVSTENGSGFSDLSTEISTKIKEYYSNNKMNNEFFINERQYQVLIESKKRVGDLLKDVQAGINRDILADLLHIILDEYNNIINPVDREDIINKIFAGFCIGK
tara:strand:- start:268 stop:1611 length:1344 start_codon:yes stop_codon:yes gene_type:complete